MNKKALIIFSIIASVIFFAAHLFFGCRVKLDNITFLEDTDAGCVLVNENDSDITFFLMNGKSIGRADGCISFKKYFGSSEEDRGYNYIVGVVENSGKFYAMNRRDHLSSKNSEYEVYMLDFKRGKCDKIFSFTDDIFTEELNALLAPDGLTDNIAVDKQFISFDVDDEGILLYFSVEKTDHELAEIEKTVYVGKLIGGAPDSITYFSEAAPYLNLFSGVISDELYELTYDYDLWVNGKSLNELTGKLFYNLMSAGDVLIATGLDGELYRVNAEELTVIPLEKECAEIKNYGVSISDVCGFYKLAGSTVTAFYDGEGSSLFCAEQGKKDAIFIESILAFIIHSIIVIALAWAAVWLIGLLLYVLKTRGRVAAKFAAAVLPAMFVCDLAAYCLIIYGISAAEEDVFQKSLQTISQQQKSLGLTDYIGDFDPNGDYKTDIGKFIITQMNSSFLDYSYSSEFDEAQARYNYFGYIQKSGFFSNISNISAGRDDVDIFAMYPSKTSGKIRRAVDEHSDIFCRIYDDGFEYIALISPTYFSGDGSINGVYLNMVSVAEVHFNTRKLMNRLIVYGLILSAVIAVLFTLCSFILLRGLKKLQKKSADYLAGGYTLEVNTEKKRGVKNEIDIISENFDKLLYSVDKDFNEIDNLRQANLAYFSNTILRIFNKKTINTIRLGDRAQMRAYCIKALLPDDYASFDNMDRLLTELGKKMNEYNAFAANIDSGSVSVYSLDPNSINILLFLREFDGRIIAAADKCYIEISIISIGGNCRCRVVKEDLQREDILMSTLINTKSSCAVTQGAADIRGELSKICVGMVDNEFIYDISDGIQERFENSIYDQLKYGIELYFKGDNSAAREMFVMILKRQQNNPVARYYINLIDKPAQKEGAAI